jgi:hypothetical protein
MAVEPLYNVDKETLLNRVRIETADDSQTLALIDQTITEVRLGFFSRLTKSRAQEIAGYPLVDNPLSDEEILRATAANTEALWVTWYLAQRLPYLFMDNSGSVNDAFNDEQLTRDTQLKEHLDALKDQIDQGLGDLVLPPDENTGATKSDLIKNETTYKPFSSFKGLYPYGHNTSISGGRV